MAVLSNITIVIVEQPIAYATHKLGSIIRNKIRSEEHIPYVLDKVAKGICTPPTKSLWTLAPTRNPW